jgi:hypothetical protein
MESIMEIDAEFSPDAHMDGDGKVRKAFSKGVVMVESTRITDAEQTISEFVPIQPR